MPFKCTNCDYYLDKDSGAPYECPKCRALGSFARCQAQINFYFRKEEYGWLSNFWRAKQHINDVYYKTNEHYYQSQKAKMIAEWNWIANAPSPFLAMIAGRALRKGKELKDDWEEIKVDIMLKGLRAKFSQNHELKEKLLATGDVIIHEDSPNDMFWGKKGKDMLGKLLMQVRDELRHER